MDAALCKCTPVLSRDHATLRLFTLALLLRVTIFKDAVVYEDNSLVKQAEDVSLVSPFQWLDKLSKLFT